MWVNVWNKRAICNARLYAMLLLLLCFVCIHAIALLRSIAVFWGGVFWLWLNLQTGEDACYFRNCLSGNRQLERIFLARLQSYLCSQADDQRVGTAEISSDAKSHSLVVTTNTKASFGGLNGLQGPCTRVLLGCDIQASEVDTKIIGDGLLRTNTFFGGTSAFVTNANVSSAVYLLYSHLHTNLLLLPTINLRCFVWS